MSWTPVTDLTSVDPLAEPTTIDEARLQMVHDLHTALYGSTWARPNSPAEVWDDLLLRVRRLAHFAHEAATVIDRGIDRR
jgi:hypothetical protein